MDEEVFETVDELPWGPGNVELVEAIELQVIEDPETGEVEVYSQEFSISGEGDCFEEAVMDFASILEAQVDELAGLSPNKLHKSAVDFLQKIRNYLPEDVLT